MHRDRVLRFLLLKHLWRLRALDSANRREEIARTLAIEPNDSGGYLVRWNADGEESTYRIDASDVVFYRRGDYNGASGADGTDRRNEDLGLAFAAHALGLSEVPAGGIGGTGDKIDSIFRRLHIGFAASGLLSLVLYPGTWIVAALQLVGAGAELWRPLTRLAPYVPAGIAAADDHAWSALLFATISGIAEALDPDGRWRAASVAAALAVAAFAVFSVQHPATDAVGPVAIFAVIAILLSGWRMIAATASTPSVYALPFLAPGLMLDGSPAALACLPAAGAALALFLGGQRAIALVRRRPGK